MSSGIAKVIVKNLILPSGRCSRTFRLGGVDEFSNANWTDFILSAISMIQNFGGDETRMATIFILQLLTIMILRE